MIDPLVVDKLKAHFKNVPPLIFHRSVERAKSEGDLFDILDTIPSEYPVIWSDELRRWIVTNDLYQAEKFDVTE